MRTRKKVKQRPERELSHEEKVMKQYYDRINSPLTAIRAKCVECMGGGIYEIANCTSYGCSLYPLRMGKNVYDKRVKAKLEREANEQRNRNSRTRRRRQRGTGFNE